MKKILLTLAVAALITFGYAPTSSSTDDSIRSAIYMLFATSTAEAPTPAELRAKYIAWDMLCFELRDIDCTGVKVPKVKTFPRNPFRPGLAGYYQGGDVIYIRNNLRGAEREEVLAHEMSHYLDVVLLGTPVPGPAKDVCFSEKRAWAVSDAYWIKYGYPNKAVGSKWADWYAHCTPFKGEMYPDSE